MGLDINIRHDGKDRLQRKIEEMREFAEKDVPRMVSKAAQEISRSAQEAFVGSRGAKIRGTDRRIGDVYGPFGLRPHVQTGNLRRSIRATKESEISSRELRWRIGPRNVEYAEAVELGRRGEGGRLSRPHPYLLGNFDEVKTRLAQSIEAVLGQIINA